MVTGGDFRGDFKEWHRSRNGVRWGQANNCGDLTPSIPGTYLLRIKFSMKNSIMRSWRTLV